MRYKIGAFEPLYDKFSNKNKLYGKLLKISQSK